MLDCPSLLVTSIEHYAEVLHIYDAKPAANGFWSARCPAHDDRSPSLRFSLGRNGSLMVRCWAGCEKAAILAVRGLTWGHLYPPKDHRRHTPMPAPVITARYEYLAEDGEVLYSTVREEPGRNGRKKDFRQQRMMPDGSWAYGISAGTYHLSRDGNWWSVAEKRPGDLELPAVRRVLYRLPELIGADPRRAVLVVEGEKCVEAAWAAGFVATTNVCGSRSKWLPEYSRVLAGRNVVVLPDNDTPGREHAEAVAGSLLLHGAATIAVVNLPDLPEKGDLVDWLAALPKHLNPKEELVRLFHDREKVTRCYGLRRASTLPARASA